MKTVSTFRRTLAASALLFMLAAPAYAQTGSPKTSAQLNAEINARIISNGQQKVTAFDFRQVLLDLISSILPDAPNYYVATTTGNDSNSCLTAALPCQTLQAAWNKMAVANHGAAGAQLNIADGTYTNGLVINGAWNGAGPLSIVGNCTSPGNVVLAPSGVVNIIVTNAFVNVSCLELRNLTGGLAELLASSGGDITFSNIRFGTTDGDQMQASGGKIHGSGPYSIVGNMGSHGHSRYGGLIDINNATVTLVGTPTIANYFFGINNASVHFTNSTFVGSATGPRFLMHFSASFNSNGAISLTGLPGNVAGTMDASSQYDSLFVGDNLPWTDYSSSVASQTPGGTPATYVVNAARVKCWGKTCAVKADVTVTNQGVGAGGGIDVDLPFAAAITAGTPGSSFEYAVSGKSGFCYIANSATKMRCADATGSTYIATGKAFVGSATYEIP